MNSKGVTLVELLVAGAIGSIVAVAASYVLVTLLQNSALLSAKGDRNVQAQEAQKFIRRLGRVASLCYRVSSSELDCNVDLNVPSTGVTTWVQFIESACQSGPCLLYAQCNPNSSYNVVNYTCGGTWVTKMTYFNISSFVVCDSNTINGGGCAIPTAAGIGAIRANGVNGAPGFPVDGRFFMYQVQGVIPTPNPNSSSSSQTLTYRSSFYVRNPITWASPGVVYQW